MLAIHLGADALGFIFYEKSARHVSIAHAKYIMDTLPPFVSKTALFVNPTRETVTQAINQLPLSVLQFHGEESSEFCRYFNFPYIKVLRVKDTSEIASQMQHFLDEGAQAVLLDTWSANQYGGTGKSFSITTTALNLPQPWILAGGLTPENIEQKLKHFKPYAVDVNSGVEKNPGIKDINKLTMFFDKMDTL